MRPSSETRLRNTLFLYEIAEREGLKVEAADIENEIEAQAARYPEDLRGYVRDAYKEQILAELQKSLHRPVTYRSGQFTFRFGPTSIGEATSLAVCVVPPSSEMHVTVYEVIAESWSSGCVKSTVTELLPRVMLLISGASGTPGPTIVSAEAGDHRPVPLPFVARTMHVYV